MLNRLVPASVATTPNNNGPENTCELAGNVEKAKELGERAFGVMALKSERLKRLAAPCTVPTQPANTQKCHGWLIQ
jgi:hypothetical protein